MQELYKKDMSRAAKLVLDGEIRASMPPMEQMMDHWAPIFTTPSRELKDQESAREDKDLHWLADPITAREIRNNEIPLTSAAGLDQITSRQWRSVPHAIRTLFYNIILEVGAFPYDLLLSRTVFVPKKDGSSTPSDFRPISVASVVVRQLHKILAVRLMKANLIDERQRGLHDGCAENTIIFDTALHQAKNDLKELHVVALDVAKAFPSVSHHAITSALSALGLPQKLINYIKTMYYESGTVFQVGGESSPPIRVKQGVRQGDPLSSVLFSLVVDRIIRSLPNEIGFKVHNISTNAVVYADDTVLFSSSKVGMETLLRIAEEEASKYGLEFNPDKSQAMSIQIAGKTKKYKVISTSLFRLSSGPIQQLRSTDKFRYLGIKIGPLGIVKPGGYLDMELNNITRAPLRPQQRLKILRCFLIPRLYHQLVLSRTTARVLKALDRQVRIAIRKWLRLPKDTPLGYFHANVVDGGLGVPAFITTVPGLMHARITSMAQSSSAIARDAAEHQHSMSLIRWAEGVLTYNGRALLRRIDRDRYWASKLHNSNDGAELREAARVKASSYWVDAGSAGIPGRDYVQYHHVRINALPTRIRTSRGRRAEVGPIVCRAGCQTTETAAHVIQGCHRTHGGRILRHDAVCRIATGGLRRGGWTVRENPHYRLPSGLLKPDLVATKGDKIKIIDAQVVSGTYALDQAHLNKCAKYSAPQLKHHIAQEMGTVIENVTVTSITLSWRGIWSLKSVEDLVGLGLGGTLSGITTRVLQGSHTNWNRWNKMTNNIGRMIGREGVG